MSTLRVPVTHRDHILGPADAPVTLVEYGDYQCPFCGEAYGVVKQIVSQFSNDLRFVFRNFPLADEHPQAMAAATFAEYAATQGQFWPAHDALYQNQDQLGESLYAELARMLHLDFAGLRRAFETNEFAERIQEDIDGGLRSGVNGTPAFFINGHLYNVRGSFEDLADAVATALAQTRG